MAVSLSKVRDEAPQMVSLVKAVNRVSLTKGLDPARDKAAVLATFDCSGSAQNLYRNGEVQAVADLAFAAGLVFDDDGSVPVSTFDNRAYDAGEITLSNCQGFLNKSARLNWGGTSYVAALNWIIEQAGYSHVNLGSAGGGGGGFFRRGRSASSTSQLTVKAQAPYPVFAIFVTDGEPQDGAEAAALLVRMSQLPIFVQFVGVGPHRFSYLHDLDDLDGRLIDNAGFFEAKGAAGTQDGMLNGLLNEFPDYLKKARAAGLITG